MIVDETSSSSVWVTIFTHLGIGGVVETLEPRELRDYLLARGEQVVELERAARLTALTPKAAAAAMTRLRRSGEFFSPASGLYVAIPPHYASWGAVPAADFIDPMMSKLGRRYYVALLSAAQIHGAAHQRPQVFQVMVDRRVPDRDFGRVRLRFYTHTRLSQIATVSRNTATGQMRVSIPEATAFDLATRPNDAGGLGNVATVLGELVMDGKLSAGALVLVAPQYPAAVSRRLGWLLDRVTGYADTSVLTDALAAFLAGVSPSVESGRRAAALLDPAGERRGPSDPRWRIVVNTEVEPDL